MSNRDSKGRFAPSNPSPSPLGSVRNGSGVRNGVSPPSITTGREMLSDLVGNALRLARSFYDQTLDRRRSIDDECGYPKTAELGTAEYRLVYDREGIPNRIVGLWPDESWILSPDLYEDEDSAVTTQFEIEFDNLAKAINGESWYEEEEGEGHPLWEYLNRIDTLSGIGSYGVLLIGIDDGLSLEEPAVLKPGGRKPRELRTKEMANPKAQIDPKTGKPKPVPVNKPIGNADKVDPITGLPIGDVPASEGKKERELLFMRAFDESLVSILTREEDPSSPRFGKPTMYEITFENIIQPYSASASSQESKTGETRKVHWTRIIHVADCIESSEIFAVPRLRPHFNRCMDLRKLLGGSGEMYWRGALPPVFFVTHPQLGTDVTLDSATTKDSIEQMLNTLSRWGFMPGVTPVQLAPAVVDPTPQINAQLQAICIKEGCPVRIFLGSERGELASSQDERAWNKRVKRRQGKYLKPRLIAPTIDRLIQMRVLPVPTRYRCDFPDLDSLTELEKADVSLKRTQALTTFVAGDGVQLMTELDWFTKIAYMSDEEAQGIIERATERGEELDEEEEENRIKEMEDFEQQQKIIGDNRPAPKPGFGGKPF